MTARLMTLLLSAACAGAGVIDGGDVCGVAVPDPGNWRRVSSGQGTFSLQLPAAAEETPLPCIDSPCGRMRVGTASIGYDSGPLAGPGTKPDPRPWEGAVQECRVSTEEGRTFDVRVTQLQTAIPWTGPRLGRQDTIPAGSYLVRAALPISQAAGGQYLWMASPSPEDRGMFLAALRTVRILRTDYRLRR